MPRATLSIPAAAEHVRTARLVAVAAARRAGLDEEAVDDVRLAVGETVARAVLRSGDTPAEVELVLRDEGDRFAVEVRDGSDPTVPDADDGVALALVRALVPDVAIDGSHVTLVWPLAPRPA
jgi:anti-sigma regulatory factor (Ser/Thr protein kinase)